MAYRLWDTQLNEYLFDAEMFQNEDEVKEALLDWGGDEWGDGSPEDIAKAKAMTAKELCDLREILMEEAGIKCDNTECGNEKDHDCDKCGHGLCWDCLRSHKC